MIFFLISFLAGVLTVLAPCVLPLLPVIVGGSLDGGVNKKKAFVVVGSLSLSIILFTFLLKYSTAFITIPAYVWTLISGVILIGFGLVSIFPEAWENLSFMARASSTSNTLMSSGFQKKSLWGDIIIGASLGPVFSTCSPTYFVILATVLPRSFAEGFVDLLAYTGGLALMLLLIAFVGQKLISRVSGISDTHSTFRKVLGVIFLVLGLAIITGVDKRIEAGILASGTFDITRLEQKLLQKTDTSSITNTSPTTSTTDKQSATATPGQKNFVASHGPQAPEFVNPSGYVNTDGKPITLSQYKGKVVLLDIWTYSCINCQRTLPYVVSWYKKYKDLGLVVIGIHTPEFAFEKVQANVEAAVKKFGIEYPVILDNDYATWGAYGNQYWPRKYLLNAKGEIIFDHIGEGNYEETEKEIQKALSELNGRDITLPVTTPTGVVTVDAGKVSSPETYFGASRNEYLANGDAHKTGEQTLQFPKSFSINKLYLQGVWNFSNESATATGPAKIHFTYSAKNVYFVASSDKGVDLQVYKDGLLEKTVHIQGNTLYTLIEGSDYGTHDMELRTESGLLDAFTFTFG